MAMSRSLIGFFSLFFGKKGKTQVPTDGATDLYLDQKVESMASCTSWTVEINGGGFVPAGAPTLKSVQVQKKKR
jgi:hypothetical protein